MDFNKTFDMDGDHNKKAKTLSMVVYGLQALYFFSGASIFAAIIINYIKNDDVRGTIYESHFRWQIRTFWYTMLWTIVSIPFVFVFIGYFTLIATKIWFIYRIVKGFLNLNDGKPMYTDTY